MVESKQGKSSDSTVEPISDSLAPDDLVIFFSNGLSVLILCFYSFLVFFSKMQSAELQIYTDFLRIVLEILNAILTYALPRNPEVSLFPIPLYIYYYLFIYIYPYCCVLPLEDSGPFRRPNLDRLSRAILFMFIFSSFNEISLSLSTQ